MKIKSFLLSLPFALLITMISVISMSSSATTIRDPNGDGVISLADAVHIYQYLSGAVLPADLTQLDVDQNGIISMADATKIQYMLLGYNVYIPNKGTNETVVVPSSSAKWYKRYDCLNQNCSWYKLTAAASDSDLIGRDLFDVNNLIKDNANIAVVRLDYSNNSQASGYIIDNHIIATAGHCVYESNSFKDLSIKIIGTNDNILATIYPRYVHIPINVNYNGNDYALIYVTQDLSQYVDTNTNIPANDKVYEFNMGVALDEFIDNQGEIVVSGFPATVPYNHNVGERFKAIGNVGVPTIFTGGITYMPELLYYDADTTGGDSGGPVYVVESFTASNSTTTKTFTFHTAIGIHNNGNLAHIEYNQGVRLNLDLLRFYFSNDYLTS